MGRRQPISNKQRKAQLQEARAIKRGDIEKPTESTHKDRRNTAAAGRSQHHLRLGTRSDDPNVVAASRNAAAKIESSRKLQSSFKKITPEFLAAWREKASRDILLRPIPEPSKHISIDLIEQKAAQELSTPKRPKWRFDMSKKEVERNEEGIFDKWIQETETRVALWRNPPLPPAPMDDDGQPVEESVPPSVILRSPTYYEQNLEVWRQLWRVTELASILLVLLDSRCPPLHYPPSLHAYLSTLRPPRKIILVLTKTDIVGQDRADLWKTWLKKRYPGSKVVGVESYRKEESATSGRASRARHVPHIPPQYMSDLIDAMKQCHDELLTPPEAIKDDPKKLAAWTPRVRRDVDWNVVRSGTSSNSNSNSSSSVPQLPRSSSLEEDKQAAVAQAVPKTQNDDSPDLDLDLNVDPLREEGEDASGPLTIGLIGQPNVGKSSLLNALFGSIKVKASRTPGKTKHFQTLFWSPQIRLVDCPGLVLPNLVPMELQVLSSILPISQIASIPSCISFAATLLPLESIFDLRPPRKDDVVLDKRTWRADGPKRKEMEVEEKVVEWTAMDIMTAYAEKKGWVTAKAGRPDVNRAGNAVLRALSEGKIRWAFLPPKDPDTILADQAEVDQNGEGGGALGKGIWIPRETGQEVEESEEDESDASDGDDDGASDDKDDEDLAPEHDSEEDEDADDNPPETQVPISRGQGMFGALANSGSDEESEDAEE